MIMQHKSEAVDDIVMLGEGKYLGELQVRHQGNIFVPCKG